MNFKKIMAAMALFTLLFPGDSFARKKTQPDQESKKQISIKKRTTHKVKETKKKPSRLSQEPTRLRAQKKVEHSTSAKVRQLKRKAQPTKHVSSPATHAKRKNVQRQTPKGRAAQKNVKHSTDVKAPQVKRKTQTTKRVALPEAHAKRNRAPKKGERAWENKIYMPLIYRGVRPIADPNLEQKLQGLEKSQKYIRDLRFADLRYWRVNGKLVWESDFECEKYKKLRKEFKEQVKRLEDPGVQQNLSKEQKAELRRFVGLSE